MKLARILIIVTAFALPASAAVDPFVSFGPLGEANVLSLTATGDGKVGGRVHLHVQFAPAEALGAVALSAIQTEAYAYGGTVLVDFTQAVFGFFITDAQGAATISQNVPDIPSLEGTAVHAQAAVIDLHQRESVALSGGLTVTFGPK